LDELLYITQKDPQHNQPLLNASIQGMSTSQSLSQRSTPKISPSVSWRAALSLPVITIYLCFIGTTFGYYTLLTYVPQYFHTILGLKLTSAAVYQIVPNLGSMILQQLGAFTIEYFSGSRERSPKCSMAKIRKIVFIVGWAPHAVCLALMGYVNVDLAIVLYSLGFIIGGYGNAVIYTNVPAIAPYHASQIMAIANTVGSITAIFCPILGGFLLDNGSCIQDGAQNDDHYNEPQSCFQAWKDFFWIIAILELLGCTLFGLFSTDKITIDAQGQRVDPKSLEIKNQENNFETATSWN